MATNITSKHPTLFTTTKFCCPSVWEQFRLSTSHLRLLVLNRQQKFSLTSQQNNAPKKNSNYHQKKIIFYPTSILIIVPYLPSITDHFLTFATTFRPLVLKIDKKLLWVSGNDLWSMHGKYGTMIRI